MFHAIRYGGKSMGNVWKCKTCGNINQLYAGTCGCGGLKEDGIQLNEDNLPYERDKKDEKIKWQCPECLKINGRDYCSCGYVKASTEKYIDKKTNSGQPIVTDKSSSKKKIIGVVIIVAIIIFLFIVAKNIFFRNNNKTKVVKYNCDTGMLINMNLKTFCSKFNKNFNNSCVEITGKNPGFDITNYINNLVEPVVGYEDGSGCKYTSYSAFIDNTYCVLISVVDDKIRTVNVVINYDNNDMPTVLAITAIQTLSGLDLNECIEIRDTIINGIMENTWVYKDGILFGINVNSSSYLFLAVSEEFLEEVNNSSNCKIIYWE